MSMMDSMQNDTSEATGYRFGKIWLTRDYISAAIGPQRSHLEFSLYFPRFDWGWYGGPDWYHRWRWRKIERSKARAGR